MHCFLGIVCWMSFHILVPLKYGDLTYTAQFTCLSDNLVLRVPLLICVYVFSFSFAPDLTLKSYLEQPLYFPWALRDSGKSSGLLSLFDYSYFYANRFFNTRIIYRIWVLSLCEKFQHVCGHYMIWCCRLISSNIHLSNISCRYRHFWPISIGLYIVSKVNFF